MANNTTKKRLLNNLTNKIIIAGGRDFNNYELLKEKCDLFLSTLEGEIEIVSGTAPGADRLGVRYADERDYGIKLFPADWNAHGKSAGYKRNKEMAFYADGLIAFWDYESSGTHHMIKLAKSHGLNVRVVKYINK